MSSRPPARLIGPEVVLGQDTESGVRELEVVNLASTGAASIAALEAELMGSLGRGYWGLDRRHELREPGTSPDVLGEWLNLGMFDRALLSSETNPKVDRRTKTIVFRKPHVRTPSG